MSTLTFTNDMARLADAMSHCHDWVVRRSAVLEALNLRTGERVLDVGCGGGFYAYTYCISRRNLRGGKHLRVQ
jgi:cyclopropane fatty-acyl-phospholipid synthase-like methyltransferase